jgi:signal transduction histidine kinase
MVRDYISDFLKGRGQFLGAVLGFWLVLPLSVLFVAKYFEQQQQQVYTAKRQLFMATEFQEMRSRVEFLFERIHQKNQAIAHIPDIRNLSGSNVTKRNEGSSKPGELQVKDLLTLFQIYSNLTALYDISEVYVVMDGFAPQNGQHPRIKISSLVNQSQQSGRPKDLDLEEEGSNFTQHTMVDNAWEMGAYQELARALDYYRQRFSDREKVVPYSHPDFLSHEILTRAPNKIPTQKIGDRSESVGFLIATPIINFDGKFVGVVATSLSKRLLESLIVDLPHPEKLAINSSERWRGAQMAAVPISHFAIVNRQLGMVVYDRRNIEMVNQIENFLHVPLDSSMASRTLLTSGESTWELAYHFNTEFEEEATKHLKTRAPIVIASVISLIFIIAVLVSWAMDRYHFVQQTLLQIDEQRQKNETLLRVVSHDINNPLAIILATVQNIQETGIEAMSEKQLRAWERIQRASDMILRTLSNVRHLQAIRGGKMKVKLTETPVENIVEEMRFIFGERLQLKQMELVIQNELAPGTCLKVDASIFGSQVLQNFVSNAIKFSRPGDKVVMCFSRVKDWLHISITDNGIGIPSELLSRIFDPAAQTSRKGTFGEEGTGFGMPLAKVYMDAMGGRIFVESLSVHTHPNNHGTTVHIYVLEGDAVSVGDSRVS